MQADSVEHLRKLLNVASGGAVFTTIQKFMPEEKGGKASELSKRRNIIVIADEAHRSQYELIDGLARNLRDSLPNTSFIGFTGTPIEKTDAEEKSEGRMQKEELGASRGALRAPGRSDGRQGDCLC